MPNKDNIRKWVEALRSGKYKQGRQALRSGLEYCCLGVACDVSGLGKWSLNSYISPDTGYSFLPKEVREFYELPSNDPPLLVEQGFEALATQLNDIEKYTFAQIADAIERTYLTEGA